MPTDFIAPPRNLPYPLDHASNLEVVYADDREPCGLPEFPEDSDERIAVVFNLSLNEFVALASAVDVGSDIAYGDDGIKVWWIWVASIMCASFCEQMADCVSDPESAFTIALADALRENPALAAAIAEALPAAGAAVPGRSLTPGQSASDILPENVRDEFGDCIPDALWGAVLYLVQSGNRAITDFFELLEFASNTLEASAIVAQAIPAAGAYASAAAEFADQLLENFQEGYAAAYTEEFETDLACALFCAAMEGCELTPDMLNEIMSSRLPDAPTLLTFGAVMNYMGAGTFLPGAVIADAMFTIYFTALQFGQQFGETVGIRPLTELMGLGADQLASDNWETLCECAPPPDFIDIDFTTGEHGFTPILTDYAEYHEDEGWGYGTAAAPLLRLGIQGDIGAYTRAIWYFNEAPATTGTVFTLEYPYPPYTVLVTTPGSGTEYDTGVQAEADGIGMDFGTSGDVSQPTLRLIKLRYYPG